jgi:hypothetical protein
VFALVFLVYHILPVYLECPFVIARSVLSNVYLVLSEYYSAPGFLGGGKCARSVIVLCYSSMQYEINV